MDRLPLLRGMAFLSDFKFEVLVKDTRHRGDVLRFPDHKLGMVPFNEVAHFCEPLRAIRPPAEVPSTEQQPVTAADVAGHNPFLIAADLIEYGEVRSSTREQTRAAVTAQLRAKVPADVRADIRRAVEQEGWELPDWLKP